MKIIIDAFGGDNAPLEIIRGCRMAVDELGVEILLSGSEAKIRACAKENNISLDGMEILDCADVLTMEDDAADIRTRKDSSMAVGLRALAEGKGDAFASAGNSGALVVGSTLFVRRIKGIRRAAFAPVMPSMNGFFIMLDGGANVECRPSDMVQYGLMGSAYLEKVMGVSNPRVGLANVGTEDHKGGPFQHEAFALLKESDLNFIGNIEGRDLPEGRVDVVLCDGFTGNLILKVYEGVAMALMDKIKGVFTKSVKNKVAAALVLKDMKAMKKEFDYNEYGGAPIIGTAKPVFKIHGSAKAKTVCSAIRLLKNYVSENVVEEMKQAVAAYNAAHPEKPAETGKEG